MATRTAEEIGRTAAGPRPVPPLARTARARTPTLARATLDTGLEVIAVRKPRSPLVEVRLRVPFAGATPKHSARAEMLAATLLLGTGSRSREQVDADLALVGGHLDAGVDPQRLMIHGSVLSTGLPMLLEVLADSLTDPAYRRGDVLGERERLVEHLAISATQPSTVAHMFLQQRRFGDHPAAWDMPDPELVAGVRPAAVHGLHRRSLVPRGSTLVLVGDLSPAKAIAQVQAALAGWSAGPDAVARRLGSPPAIAGDDLLAHHRPGAVQSQIRLSGAAVQRDDPSYPAHQLANLVYGGYFSSRLVENIREDKGYTYSARSSLEFWPGAAAVSVAFDTTTESTAPALLEARYELGRISLQAPKPEEVESARNYALGTLATSLSTQAGLASTLSMVAGAGLDENWLRDHPVRLAAVTVDDVAAAAASMLAPARFTGVVVGDVGVLERELLGLGNVVFA
jgi:zinc protease